MKLYNSIGPNPHVVRMFIHEKGIEIERQDVDIVKGTNREGDFLVKNPYGQLPCLEMDNGVYLCEILPICEYLEDKHPEPALIGTNAEEKAVTRMWTRRLDLNVCEPMANGFRFAEGLKMFKDRIHTIPQAADDLKAAARKHLEKLDKHMESNQFIVGDRFTLADIFLFCFLKFGGTVKQPLDPQNKNLHDWYQRVTARPSANA